MVKSVSTEKLLLERVWMKSKSVEGEEGGALGLVLRSVLRNARVNWITMIDGDRGRELPRYSLLSRRAGVHRKETTLQFAILGMMVRQRFRLRKETL